MEKVLNIQFFAGKDASRSFVSGDFAGEGIRDDIDDLSIHQVGEINKWQNFYRDSKDYKFVGLLIGRYYNEMGKPTEYFFKLKGILEEYKKEEQERKRDETEYPGCNSKWSQNDGGEVWCSDNSAGIKRDWSGLPRKYFKAGGKDWRCVCVHPSKLDNPQLKLYEDCDKKGEVCKFR